MTSGINTIIEQSLESFESISLDKMNELALLNRIDTKYVMSIGKLLPLLQAIENSYQVLEIENKRVSAYHTQYYDYPDKRLYLNHQNGLGNRYKIRHRKYLANNLSFLEIKRKTNKGKTLKYRKLAAFNPVLTAADYDFLRLYLPINDKQLCVSSQNTFHRITLAAKNKTERVTIDTSLSFTDKKTSQNLDHLTIVELKRSKNTPNSIIGDALKNLQVYPRGFSKYCMGMALLNKDLKQNKFKQNLLFLNKIKNEHSNN